MQRWKNLNTEKDPEDLGICTFCYPAPTQGTTPPILYEDEEVYVMPALGHFRNGYVLLITQDHADCYGDVANEHKNRVKERVREVLTDTYGSCCFYEHGRVGSCLARSENRICYHAHLHCLPIPENFTDRLASEFERVSVDEWTDIVDLSEEYSHYLYLETDDGEKSFFVVEDSIERQYLRKRACEALGHDTELANWVENPRWDDIYDTYADLRGQFDPEELHPDH